MDGFVTMSGDYVTIDCAVFCCNFLWDAGRGRGECESEFLESKCDFGEQLAGDGLERLEKVRAIQN